MSSNIRLVSLDKMFRPYRFIIAKAITALIISSFCALMIPWALRYYIDHGISDRLLTHQSTTTLIFVAVSAGYASSSAYRYYQVTWLGERVAMDLRERLFKHVLYLPRSFHDRMHSGNLLSQILADTAVLETVFSSSLSLIMRNIILFTGCITMMVITSWQLALLFFCLAPFMIVPVILIGRRYRRYSRDVQDKLALSHELASEVLANVEYIQSSQQQEVQYERFQTCINATFAAAGSRIVTRAWLTAVLVFLMALLIVLILSFGSYLVHASKDAMSYGMLVQFLVYALLMAVSTATVSESWGEVLKALGALDRIDETLQEPVETEEDGKMLLPKSICIDFNNVGFTYPSSERNQVLSDINFTIKPGSFVAVVGPSGAGKSTLFKLLLKLYKAQQGSIYINNTPLSEYQLASLRQNIVYVPQEPVLFSATLRDNITMMQEVDDRSVEEACKYACLNEVVSELKDGLNTFLGERGLRLSTGQRQRVGLARAFLKKGSLILLDEPTSSIDSINEVLVSEAMSLFTERGATCFVIAHRLYTIEHADEIIVLDQGKVVAIGDHSTLLKSSELYRDLSRQLDK